MNLKVVNRVLCHRKYFSHKINTLYVCKILVSHYLRKACLYHKFGSYSTGKRKATNVLYHEFSNSRFPPNSVKILCPLAHSVFWSISLFLMASKAIKWGTTWAKRKKSLEIIQLKFGLQISKVSTFQFFIIFLLLTWVFSHPFPVSKLDSYLKRTFFHVNHIKLSISLFLRLGFIRLTNTNFCWRQIRKWGQREIERINVSTSRRTSWKKDYLWSFTLFVLSDQTSLQ